MQEHPFSPENRLKSVSARHYTAIMVSVKQGEGEKWKSRECGSPLWRRGTWHREATLRSLVSCPCLNECSVFCSPSTYCRFAVRGCQSNVHLHGGAHVSPSRAQWPCLHILGNRFSSVPFVHMHTVTPGTECSSWGVQMCICSVLTVHREQKNSQQDN